ncbi:MAG: discoidin domain-containing protein [Planctomycetota bacterium]
MTRLQSSCLVTFLLLALVASDLPAQVPTGTSIDLAGNWTVRLDPEDVGDGERWFASALDGVPMALPGTTDLAGIGFPLDPATMTYPVASPNGAWPGASPDRTADQVGHLVREHLYLGRAWYQREIELPAAWAGKFVRLHLERVLWQSRVWLDDEPLGVQDSLAAPHMFEFGPAVPGEHLLTICVDNRMIHDIGIYGHSYGPETQSRWNGVVGEMRLEAVDAVSIERLDLFPAADARSAGVRLHIRNRADSSRRLGLRLLIHAEGDAVELGASEASLEVPPGDSRIVQAVLLEKEAARWDEFTPVLHELRAELRAPGGAATAGTLFGFRRIERDGLAIRVNGRRVFLRGTLDCCVYPRTGHPPTSEEEWSRVLGVMKEHGFNHVRFHTWCPPDAAFRAADRLGVYLAPETAWWVDNWIAAVPDGPQLPGKDEVAAFIAAEIRRISEAYGNHPSFAFFCIGNEFGMDSDWDLLDRMIGEAKEADPRRLYNASTARKTVPNDDYQVTHSTGSAPTRGIGPPGTDWDFAAAVASSKVPLIAHETGQRPVFPRYRELLPKFDGPLEPYNLERLQRGLEASGLTDQIDAFVDASARFQLLLYKAEHEGMLRTPGFSGYQLLMLNDFTGQSEALVGILDPFFETKGAVTAEEVRSWNGPTTPLARFPRFTWSTSEDFRAELEVAHFGPGDLADGSGEWSLTTAKGKLLLRGRTARVGVPTGGLTPLGRIEVPLNGLDRATALDLRVSIHGATNSWRLWAYPPVSAEPSPESVLVRDRFDGATRTALEEGTTVLLLAQGIQDDDAARCSFQPVYWSGGWWGNRFSHLGLIADPAHPAFSGFPHDGHADWQWQPLLDGATIFDLRWAPLELRPIVQGIPDFHHNARLGLLWEARVGAGKLLVCGLDLSSDLAERPAARALRKSLLDYAASDSFQPQVTLEPALLREKLGVSKMVELGARVISADSEATGFEASRLIDGNPGTFWHTPWTGTPRGFPHEVVIDLGQELELSGLRLRQRPDGNRGGKIRSLRIETSLDDKSWQIAFANLELEAGAEPQSFSFPAPTSTRYLRLTPLSSHEGKAWASLAELEVH